MELSIHFQAFGFAVKKGGNPENQAWDFQLFFEKVIKLNYSLILNR